jgi:hypothetical protein
MLQYQSRYSVFDFSIIILICALLLFCLISLDIFNSLGFSLMLMFLVYYLWHCKLFDVYETKLVVRYPRVLLRKPRVIILSEIVSIEFEYGRRGEPHLMTVVYENSKIKYRFWGQSGLDLCRVFKLLKSNKVLVLGENSWNCG